MTTYLPLDVASNDFTAGKAGTHSGYFTTISGKSYIFVYTKDNSADTGDDSAMIGYDPSDVSATLNSGAGTGAGDVSGWAHSTTSFTANPHTLTHLSNTTYNWGLTSDIGATNISFTGLRTKYISSALISGHADLKVGTDNTKLSNFRGIQIHDGTNTGIIVPTGATDTISIGSVFKEARFVVSSKVGHVNTDANTTGKHTTYSYLKLTFSSASIINWYVSSEAVYDLLYIYVEEDAAPAPSGFAYKFFLIDSYGDGWNAAELYVQDSSSNYLTITPTGSPNGTASAVINNNGITLPSGFGSSSVVAGTIPLPAGAYTITVTPGSYSSEITWSVKDDADALVSFTTGGTTPVNGTFYLTVGSTGGGQETS